MPTLIDGKATAQQIKDELKKEVDQLKAQGKRPPHLAAILVGDDPASHVYVKNKVKYCNEVGYGSTLVQESADISGEKLFQQIRAINENPEIDGLIVQQPLPGHINVEKVVEAIRPEKDVDGFHPINIGRLAKNLPSYVAATPFGIMQLLERYNVPTEGRHCVVIGRSDIVGTPMSLLLSRKANPGNATVTLCHSRTNDIASYTRQADIIIAAIGKTEFLTADMVKQGVSVIDVGMNRVEDASKKRGYALKGDVKFDEVAEKADFITPVPGGVGPMTVASLMYNTLLSAKGEIY